MPLPCSSLSQHVSYIFRGELHGRAQAPFGRHAFFWEGGQVHFHICASIVD